MNSVSLRQTTNAPLLARCTPVRQASSCMPLLQHRNGPRPLRSLARPTTYFQPHASARPSLKLTAHPLGPRRTISIRGEFRGLVQEAVSVGTPASNVHSHPRRCAYGNNPISWADSDRACS